MTAVGAVGIELWSMSSDIYFDNLLITDSREIANQWAADTFDLKVQLSDRLNSMQKTRKNINQNWREVFLGLISAVWSNLIN